MKYLFFILLSLLSVGAFADDFETSLSEIATFKSDEFENAGNYKEGSITGGILSDEFVSKLLGDDKLLRYFFVSYIHYHFDKRYQSDKVYTASINKKFEQKTDLTEEQERIIKRSLASLVFTDKIESLKNALPDNDRESDDYFLKIMNRLEGVRLR